eukprot:scaffold34878_cov101-Isochrysis_galbana.AAC.3
MKAKVVPNAEHGGRRKNGSRTGGAGGGADAAPTELLLRARAVKCSVNYQLNSDSRLIGCRLMHAVQTTVHMRHET